MSERQMALAIATVAGLLLVAFGLGVAVGLLQSGGDSSQGVQEQGFLVAGEPQAGVAPTFGAWAGHAQAVATPAPEESAGLAEARPTPAVAPSPEATTAPTPAPTLAPTPALAAAPTPALTRTPTPTGAPTATPATPTAIRIPPSARPTAPVAVPAGLWIQVGSLSQAQQGEGLKQRVIAMGFTPEQVVVVRAADGRYRVRVGPFPDEESAGRVLARIRTQGLPDAFFVRE